MSDAKTLAAKIAAQEDAVKKLLKSFNELHKSNAEVAKFIEKPPAITFPGLVKDYADAVKSSGGLTSMKPSCVKVIEKAEKSPDPDTLAAAVKALSAHADEVGKVAKTDKKAATFVKDIDELNKKLVKASKF